jgi:hypothetical protein
MIINSKAMHPLNSMLRRIILVSLLLTPLIRAPLLAQNWLAIATQKGKAGFIDETGRWKIKPVYDEATGFYNGLAAVRSGELWSYINNRGDYVIPPGFDHATPFYNRQFAVVTNGQDQLYINRKGEILFDASPNLVIFYEDLAAFEMNGKFGFINKNHEWEILPEYDQVWPFRNGIAKVKRDGQWIYISRLGKEMYDVQMDTYASADKALLFKKSKDQQWGFVNSEGEWIISPVYDDVKSFSEGLSPVKLNDRWGYINMKGELVIDTEYDDAFVFSHWLGCVEVEGKYGCVDNRGEMVIKPRFENPLFFHFAEDFLGLDIVSAESLEDIVPKSEITVPEVTVASQKIYVPDDKRLALVIGNGNYTRGGFLSNPENDARAMAEALKRLGFETMVHFNVNQVTLKQAIDDFGNRLRHFDTGLFFYAGHGIQVKGFNYLIPVDASLESEIDVEYNCVEAGRMLSRMEESGSRTNIVILDACRDNPFERSWTRKAQGQGLAFMNAPSGSLIAYATSPGSTASDGPGKNGLYTSSLLKFMNSPGLTILEVFQKVRSEVREKSNNRQTPWESTSLEGNFYFRD